MQTIADCPLRWLLERHGGTDGRDLRSSLGSVLHMLIADDGKTEALLVDLLEKIWDALPFDSQLVFAQRARPLPGDAVGVLPVAGPDPP